MRIPILLTCLLVAGCGAPAGETAPPPADPITTAGLVLRPQADWIVEEPSSSMRAAQFRLPRAAGDDADASLVVYWFGGGGGSIEANLERWRGQFEGGGGEESMRTVGELTLHELAIAGTYVAETAPGSGERVDEPGWRMRAAVVETPAGPYYLKLVGPDATVRRWEPSYEAFVASLKPSP